MTNGATHSWALSSRACALSSGCCLAGSHLEFSKTLRLLQLRLLQAVEPPLQTRVAVSCASAFKNLLNYGISAGYKCAQEHDPCPLGGKPWQASHAPKSSKASSNPDKSCASSRAHSTESNDWILSSLANQVSRLLRIHRKQASRSLLHIQ